MADDASVARFHDAVGDRPVDILIANAGTYGGKRQTLGDLDFDAWRETFEINSLGPVRLARPSCPT